MATSHTDQQGLLAASENPFATLPPLSAGAPPTGRINSGGSPSILPPGTPGENILRQSSHPVALIFHVIFRIAALVMYLFSGIFTESFVFVFVVCVVLLSFDFWTVKNISGRLLVGLRWWNDVREDGSSTWAFESKEPTQGVNAIDSKYSVIWGFLIIIAAIRLHWGWMLVPIIAVMLSAANLIGYQRCEKDAQQRWRSWATNAATSNGFISGLVQRGVTSWFTRST
ncbi:hypothetical protein BDF19DRAFT_432192 [Syncephalis fuscata]|nr:hypothetical protein BDF19DRAFT_432192 [Syncephalis fuscata]